MSILFLTPVEWVTHRAAIWLALFSFRLTLHVLLYIRDTQREYSSKPLKHRVVDERILVFKR